MHCRMSKGKSEKVKAVATLKCRHFIILLLFCAIVCFSFSCSSKNEQIEQNGNLPESASVHGSEEESPGDSVSSVYLKNMIHSGRKVLLNFCYCCDCKVTKPVLVEAIENMDLTVQMITIDVKEDVELADEYGGRKSPFYILFEEYGHKVDTLYGFREDDLMNSEEIQRWLKRNLIVGEEEQDEN